LTSMMATPRWWPLLNKYTLGWIVRNGGDVCGCVCVCVCIHKLTMKPYTPHTHTHTHTWKRNKQRHKVDQRTQWVLQIK
jgi:hypothetical protein